MKMKPNLSLFVIISFILGLSASYEHRPNTTPVRPLIPRNYLLRPLSDRDESHLIPLEEIDGTNDWLRKTKVRPIHEKDLGPAMD